MLRSRNERPGRFHASPNRADWVYFSSAGATARTSSSVGMRLYPGVIVAGAPSAQAEPMNHSEAMIVAGNFISISSADGVAAVHRKRVADHETRTRTA